MSGQNENQVKNEILNEQLIKKGNRNGNKWIQSKEYNFEICKENQKEDFHRFQDQKAKQKQLKLSTSVLKRKVNIFWLDDQKCLKIKFI